MAKKTSIIQVEEFGIRFYTEQEDDFISLTDMAKKMNSRTEQVIQNWMRNRNTLEFLGLWEKLYNPEFNHLEFEVIRNKAGLNSFTMSVSEWAGSTGAIGIRSKAGRYGGTFAHKDIAFEFGSWLSPAFKLLVIKEFQRLKKEEAAQKKELQEWNLKRTLSKVNYLIHTDAVKEHLIPPRVAGTKMEGLYYASEADLLNLAMFGMTAKEWRLNNPEAKGNARDNATAEQLLVLANLENLNAEFIRQGFSKEQRLERLNEIAIYQMQLLVGVAGMKRLGNGE